MVAVRRGYPCPVRGIEAKKERRKEKKEEKKEEDDRGSWKKDPLLEGVGTYIYTYIHSKAHQVRIRFLPPSPITAHISSGTSGDRMARASPVEILLLPGKYRKKKLCWCWL